MKIAIISDTHFGYKNDASFFLEESLSFFENVFFPYLKENKIRHVIHMGDLLDRRKYVNFFTLNQIHKRFASFFKDNDINVYLTIGNHDTYFKNTNAINSIKELFSFYDNFNIIENPTELYLDGLKLGLVPWITKDNEDLCYSFINSTSASILVGHFEINGFEIITGIKHSSGNDEQMFNKFDKVLSGHFHIRQSRGNIHYLGSQYQMNFGDINCKKGFTVLDTNTRELEFIENTRKIFHVLKYDDSTDNEVEKLNPESIKNCYIKLVVINKKRQKKFEQYVDYILSNEPQEFTIIEDLDNQQEKEDDVDVTQDTLTIIAKEIDNTEQIKNKEKVKTIIKDLYIESMSL